MNNERFLFRATYQRFGCEAKITFAERDMDYAQAFMQRLCDYMSTRRQPAKVISVECLRPLVKQLELVP